MAKGYAQQYGIYYFEILSHVAIFKAIRIIFSIAAQMKRRSFQFDMRSIFLNGYLNEHAYV